MKWSFSKLKTFESCPAKFNYKYNMSLAEDSGPAANRGTILHKYFEDYIKSDADSMPLDLVQYTPLLDGIKKKGGLAEYKVFLDRNWQPVLAGSADIWYTGIIDALVVDPPEAWKYDWKSGKEYDDHYEQKEIYTLAIFGQFPEVQEVRAFHVYIDSGRTTLRQYSRAQVQPMRDRWASRAGKLASATHFPPNPSYGCKWCSFSKAKGGPCRF